MAESKQSSRRRRLGVAAAAIALAYLGIGFFVVPIVVEGQLVSVVESQIGVTPTIEAIRFSPLDLRLEVEGFALPDPEGSEPALSFGLFAVDTNPIALVFDDLGFEEVILIDPTVLIDVDTSGELNWVRMLAAAEEVEPAAPVTDVAGGEDVEPIKERGLVVDIDSIQIQGGAIHFRDQRSNEAFEMDVQPLDLVVRDFTTGGGGDEPYTFALDLKAGERSEIHWKGAIGLDPVQSDGHIAIQNLDLRTAWDYYKDSVRFEIEEGELTIGLDYALRLEELFSLELTKGEIEVRGLELLDHSDSSRVLSLPALKVSDLDARVVDANLVDLGIAEVALDGGRMATRLEDDGQVHLLDLLTPVVTGEEVSGSAATLADNPSGTPEEAPETPTAEDGAASPSTPAPTIQVEKVVVREFTIEFDDRTTSPPVELRLAPLNLSANGFSTAPGSAVRLEIDSGVGEAGTISAQGPLQLDPLALQLAIQARDIALSDFQPYAASFARLDIPGGRFNAKVDFDFAAIPSEPARITVQGRAQIDDLATYDQRGSREFLKWKALRLEGIDYGPDQLRLLEIGLSEASIPVVVGADGTSNLTAIFTAGESADTEPAGPESSAEGGTADGSPLSVQIAKITLDDFSARFSDESMGPGFTTRLEGLSGTIEGLSSDELARAAVDLAGRVDGRAPVKIKGQINPLSEDAYTDIRISVSDMSLPMFTPYSGRYVGYRIDRGKLALDLDYKLSANSLQAENKVSLMQFAFGEKVESPQATSLPVPLAISLMRDASGDIEIDLPIRGRVDDPSFSVFGLLRKALVNLVSKVAASPFNMVGSLIGASSDDLSRVRFAPGSDRVTETESSEIAGLASALASREDLQIEIRGRADPEVDGAAVRGARVDEEVRMELFRSLSRREQRRLGRAEAIPAGDERLLGTIERLYAERSSESVDDLIARSAKAPGDSTDEARQAHRYQTIRLALAEKVPVSEAEWQRLARARAAAVKGALIAAGDLSADRIFLVEVDVGSVADPGGDVPTELALTTR